MGFMLEETAETIHYPADSLSPATALRTWCFSLVALHSKMKLVLFFIIINSSLWNFLAITLLQELYPQYKIPLAMNNYNWGPLEGAK